MRTYVYATVITEKSNMADNWKLYSISRHERLCRRLNICQRHDSYRDNDTVP